MIGGFRSVLCVSVFQGSFLVIVIMTDGSEKLNCAGGFWTSEIACFLKSAVSLARNNFIMTKSQFLVQQICLPNTFSKHYKQQKLTWRKLLAYFFFKNHNCNPLQSSSGLSIHASFYFVFAVLYPLFMFWAVMFMFHSVWCQFLLRSLTL